VNARASRNTDLVLNVKNADTSMFTINARGDIQVSGVIVVRDNNLAGSVVTLDNGTAEVTFSYDLGTGKPSVQLTAESENPTFAQIAEWKKDDQQHYTGFVIKAFNLTGAPQKTIVHYLVVAKQDGFQTFGIDTLNVVTPPNNASLTPPSSLPAATPADSGTTPPISDAPSPADTSGQVAGDATDVPTPPALPASPTDNAAPGDTASVPIP
jgi:hypothetical protein